VVRAEPFVEIDLELGLLWSDPADAVNESATAHNTMLRV
jgi:hypothetical protein